MSTNVQYDVWVKCRVLVSGCTLCNMFDDVSVIMVE